ncbi:MAG: TIGR00730 family Rossman fold protein [Parvibaculaceae bacterium]|nr:TIGR00730 family Rossman fold protein [Parvibaculaceae bacterium]
MKLENLCVYCGSSDGREDLYLDAAIRLGAVLAREKVGLVYGGASIGLMGALARSVLEGGGKVTGVIPDFLQRAEVMMPDVSELVVTGSMHERKWDMFSRSQAFVALPGGIGTLEEVIEMLTWAQLGRHSYPIIFANIGGFWNPLIELIEHMIETGFVRSNLRSVFGVVDRVEDILPRVRAGL